MMAMFNLKTWYVYAAILTTAVIVVVIMLSVRQSESPRTFSQATSLSQFLFPESSAPWIRTRKANPPPDLLQEVEVDYMYTTDDIEGEAELTLPFPLTTLPTKVILQQQWVRDLQKILSVISPESPPVHIIAGNYKYREVLLNWLISAKVRVDPPVENIIVLSIDSPLCDLLNKKNITCVYAHWTEYLVKELTSPFAAILVLRLTIIRLLNYWGYDAANIDTDALILKNPEPLYQEFNESDMLASRSHGPPTLDVKWGVTICAGAFLIRSTPNSGTPNF